MHQVHPGLLWIGNAHDARNARRLFDTNIAAVIDVAIEERPAQLPRQLVYCRFPLHDGAGNELHMLWQPVRTALGFLRAQVPTLIACSAGMSRSPAVAAVALAKHLGEEPDAMVARIAEMRSLELKSELWSALLQAVADGDPDDSEPT